MPRPRVRVDAVLSDQMAALVLVTVAAAVGAWLLHPRYGHPMAFSLWAAWLYVRLLAARPGGLR